MFCPVSARTSNDGCTRRSRAQRSTLWVGRGRRRMTDTIYPFVSYMHVCTHRVHVAVAWRQCSTDLLVVSAVLYAHLLFGDVVTAVDVWRTKWLDQGNLCLQWLRLISLRSVRPTVHFCRRNSTYTFYTGLRLYCTHFSVKMQCTVTAIYCE